MNKICFIMKKKKIIYIFSFFLLIATNNLLAQNTIKDSGPDQGQMPWEEQIATSPILYRHLPNSTVSFSYKKGLTIESYNKQIKKQLEKMFPSAFPDKDAAKYLFKALSENAYSLNGYLGAKTYNSIIDGYNKFFIIHGYVEKLPIHSSIKDALTDRYAQLCIYKRDERFIAGELKKLKRIPDDAILFNITTEIDSKEAKSKYIRWDEFTPASEGANLYYICLNNYKNFKTMSMTDQKKILDEIFSYNPTLTYAGSLKLDYDNFFGVMTNYFKTKKERILKNSVLEYRVKYDADWIILPNDIMPSKT